MPVLNVRLVDVAAAAGVSMKTVSNVVNDFPHVRPELRARVQAVIDDLGYRPNITARRLVAGRTKMIALAIPEIDVPYFAELARRVSAEAAQYGYRVLIQQTIDGTDAERAAIDVAESGLVDGVLLQPMMLTAEEITLARRRHPLVLLGEGDAPPEVDRAMIDNVAAAHQAVRHLAVSGRSRIAFLGREVGELTPATRDRIAGYRAGLEFSGLQHLPELTLPIAGFSSKNAAMAVQSAIDAGLLFDGIICRDDGIALGALRALRANRIAVPHEVAVVGWDDDRADEFLETSLTSISPDKQELARVAFGMLIDRIEGFDGPGRHVIVPHSLSVRESAPIDADARESE